MLRNPAIVVLGGILALVLSVFAWNSFFREPSLGLAATPPEPQEATRAEPVPMSSEFMNLIVSLGLKDKSAVEWKGAVRVSEGRVLRIEIQRSGQGGLVKENRFLVRSEVTTPGTREALKRLARTVVLGPVLLIKLDAPPSATVQILMPQGERAFFALFFAFFF